MPQQHRRRGPALLAGKKIERRAVVRVVIPGKRTRKQEPPLVRQLGRREAVGHAVKFLDRTLRPLGGERVPSRAKIIRQRMPRLEQIDKAETHPIDRHRTRLIDPGKKCALCHDANLSRATEPAQAIGSRLISPKRTQRSQRGAELNFDGINGIDGIYEGRKAQTI